MSAALLLIDIQKDYFPGGRMELVGALRQQGQQLVCWQLSENHHGRFGNLR
jgi:nicotinamidase-related amidase